MRIKLKRMKMKIKKMSHLKKGTLIKGEMPMIKTRKMRVQNRHTQESTKQYNEIIP
jgi:flagellar motor switch protein FliM